MLELRRELSCPATTLPHFLTVDFIGLLMWLISVLSKQLSMCLLWLGEVKLVQGGAHLPVLLQHRAPVASPLPCPLCQNFTKGSGSHPGSRKCGAEAFCPHFYYLGDTQATATGLLNSGHSAVPWARHCWHHEILPVCTQHFTLWRAGAYAIACGARNAT